jgi:hypothetical protein
MARDYSKTGQIGAGGGTRRFINLDSANHRFFYEATFEEKRDTIAIEKFKCTYDRLTKDQADVVEASFQNDKRIYFTRMKSYIDAVEVRDEPKREIVKDGVTKIIPACWSLNIIASSVLPGNTEPTTFQYGLYSSNRSVYTLINAMMGFGMQEPFKKEDIPFSLSVFKDKNNGKPRLWPLFTHSDAKGLRAELGLRWDERRKSYEGVPDRVQVMVGNKPKLDKDGNEEYDYSEIDEFWRKQAERIAEIYPVGGKVAGDAQPEVSQQPQPAQQPAATATSLQNDIVTRLEGMKDENGCVPIVKLETVLTQAFRAKEKYGCSESQFLAITEQLKKYIREKDGNGFSIDLATGSVIVIEIPDEKELIEQETPPLPGWDDDLPF